MPRSRLVLALTARRRRARRHGARRCAADVPVGRTLYKTGPSGRYLVDGDWLFRLDTRGARAAQRLPAQLLDPRLEDRPRCPTRGTPTTTRPRASSGPSAGTARTSSCRPRPAAYSGSCASSRSTTARGCGSTAPDRRERRRLPAVRGHGCPARAARAAASTGSWSASTTGAPRTTSRRMGSATDRHSRRAAGGTTAACCARSTCAASTTSTSRPSRCCPTCRAATCDGTVVVRATVRNFDAVAQRVSVTGTFGTKAVLRRDLHARPRRQARRSPRRCRSPSPSCGRPARRTSTRSS